MSMKKTLLGLGLAAMMAPALAQPPLYFFEDDDLDWVLTWDGSAYVPKTTGTLSEGDVLFSVFEIPTFEIDGVDQLGGVRELTGIAAVQVASEIGGSYTFQVWDDFNAYTGLALPAGAAVAMWLDDTPDLELVGDIPAELSCDSLAACIAQATDGTLLQVDGFAGDPDEEWTGLATTTSLDEIQAGASTTPYVVFNAKLSALYHSYKGTTTEDVCFLDETSGLFAGCDLGYVDDGNVQILVSGTVLGGAGLSSMDVIGRSDFQGRKYVPEPATLALFGIGLLGLGRRMKRA